MTPARALHDIFAGLAGEADAPRGDAAGVLRDGGHGELPGELVAEAIVSYADTAPVEVAEHLAPFVTVHSAVPHEVAEVAEVEVTHGLDLLATAPAAVPEDIMPAPGADGDAMEYGSSDTATAAWHGADDEADAGDAATDPFDLAFGEGDRTGEAVTSVAFDSPPGAEDVVVEEPDEPAITVDPSPGPDPADLFPLPAASGPDEDGPDDEGVDDG